MQSKPLTVVMSIAPSMRRGPLMNELGGQVYQKQCIQAWQDAGAQVISVNSFAEIEVLEERYRGVVFVPSNAQQNSKNPRGLPLISELIDAGSNNCIGDVFAIANSDVYFEGDKNTLGALFDFAQSGAVFSHRHEKASLNITPGLPYLYGFDVVIVNKQYILSSEMKDFFIGSPWWDYLFLYLLAARGVPLSNCICPLMSHLTHEQAWSEESWLKGLSSVALLLRKMAVDEGPVAALLSHICLSLDPDASAGFAVDGIKVGLGIVLGTSMVSYINERCQYVLWLDDNERSLHSQKLAGTLKQTHYKHASSLQWIENVKV